MKKDVAIFGNGHCARAVVYQREMDARGISYEFFDIDSDQAARAVLASFYPDGIAKAPALIFGGKLYRNPKTTDLDKLLARAGIYDPGLIHDLDNQRYIRHMNPADAFVSYSRRGETVILGHIEVPHEKRGSGIGARVAAEVFEEIIRQEEKARVTCPFLRRVALSKPHWKMWFID